MSNSSHLSDGGDEGYPSPDDDITLEGSVNRQKLREESRRKRKLRESLSISTGQDNEDAQLWAEMVRSKFNTPEKIGNALLHSKLSTAEMQRWLSMVSKEVSSAGGGGKKRKLKNDDDYDSENRLMPLETFNNLLEPQYAKFTPEEYVVPRELIDKKSFFYKSRNDPDLNFIFVKRDREARLSEKWEDFRIKKIEEAAKKGRIADKAVFRAKNKEECYRFGLSVDEGWALYKKSWSLLMGLEPSANVDRFFRREKPATIAAAAAAAAAAAPAAAVAADDYLDDGVDDSDQSYEDDAYVPTSPTAPYDGGVTLNDDDVSAAVVDAGSPLYGGVDGDGSTTSFEDDDDVSSPATPATPY